jgi:hypothetical protein
MLFRLALVSLVSGTSAFGTELVLSRADSGQLAGDAIFPFKSTEIISENGRELSLTIRELITNDSLLKFSCKTKTDAGQIVDIVCKVVIHSNVEPLIGNERTEGQRGMLRASISASDDVLSLKESFQNSGLCRSHVQSQIFSASKILARSKSIRSSITRHFVSCRQIAVDPRLSLANLASTSS